MTVKKMFFFFFVGMTVCKYFDDKMIKVKNNQIERRRYHTATLERWLTLYDNGITINRYLKDKGYHRVVIYGLKDIGWHLYRQLRNSGIEIIGMDRADIRENYQMPIYKPDDDIGNIDLMIVTSFKYKEVYQSLSVYQYKMISFPDLLGECEKYLYGIVE